MRQPHASHALAKRQRAMYGDGRFLAELDGDHNKMNRFERLFGLKGEARVKFLDGEFQVVSPGDFVTCAVTGEPIALPDLRYWSVELQEAYSTADVSLQRYREMRHKLHRD